jgi:ribosomal-protein-alanine N-acetyltransferase
VLPTITTTRLCLREIVHDDAPDIFQLRSDAEAQRYNTRPMRSVLEAHALVSTMHHWFRSRQAIQWGITLRGIDRVVGICGLHDWLPAHRRALLGYDLVRPYWGQGLAQEAVREVVRFGFEEMELNRLQALTIVENARSIRLLERLGFTRASINHEPDGDGTADDHDSVVYGLRRQEYDDGAGRSGGPPTAAPAP